MYEIDAFFWYKAVFMAELLLAEMLVSFRLARRKKFWLRIAGAVMVCIGVAFAMPVLDDGALFATFMYLAFFGVTLGALWLCFDVDFRTVAFCGLAGYAMQHISYELFDIAAVVMGVHNMSDVINVGSNPFGALITIVYGSGKTIFANAFIVAVYLTILFVTYWAVCRIVSPSLEHGAVSLKNGAMLVIFALTILFGIVISAVITEHSATKYDPVYVIVADVANVFCCALTLYMQFGMAKIRKLDRELDTINKLWEQSKAQYDLTKTNIDLINFKCHDLKHQIRTMGAKNSLSPEALDEMENLISVYDSGVRTGNGALDVILTEKSLYCNRHGILLSCVADGKQLAFIGESDLYAIFGNILDNAIEAVSTLDKDDRVVGISVKCINDFVFVNVYNFYGGDLEFDGGLPRSTKGDALNHGFGMKSVRMLAEKYGGELKVTAEDGIFNTDIIFPR